MTQHLSKIFQERTGESANKSNANNWNSIFVLTKKRWSRPMFLSVKKKKSVVKRKRRRIRREAYRRRITAESEIIKDSIQCCRTMIYFRSKWVREAEQEWNRVGTGAAKLLYRWGAKNDSVEKSPAATHERYCLQYIKGIFPNLEMATVRWPF